MNSKLSINNKSAAILKHFMQVRAQSEKVCAPLEVEDYSLQAIAETSPAKWHLAHTSWFFETFILKVYEHDFKPFVAEYEFLFNSYYNAVGKQFPRPKRGLLSRPTVKEVYAYRANINQRIEQLILTNHAQQTDIFELVLLGVNHEQQHQELFFTDLLYNLYQNPLLPNYSSSTQPANSSAEVAKLNWITFNGGLISTGQEPCTEQAIDNFCFDNESPAHQYWLQPFQVADRLVTNGEYLAFINAAGYQTAKYWLSDGWAKVQQEKWQAPLYWFKKGQQWFEYSLNGAKELDLNAPVSHISAYEADAYANWQKARLLTEHEWELVAKSQSISGSFLESKRLRASFIAKDEKPIKQLYGELWQWTSSAYQPYPGFTVSDGAIGEYNGKFMTNQLVLRGGSCVTAKSHIRATYRNFFYPESRWQFTGIRLARNTENN